MRLHLHTPRAYTCRLLGVTRADSGGFFFNYSGLTVDQLQADWQSGRTKRAVSSELTIKPLPCPLLRPCYSLAMNHSYRNKKKHRCGVLISHYYMLARLSNKFHNTINTDWITSNNINKDIGRMHIFKSKAF